ncbi:ROK family protein, partial [Agromyces binzhouensis]
MSLVDARDADGYVVGIDLGGTKVRAGIAALDASDGPRARAALVEA